MPKLLRSDYESPDLDFTLCLTHFSCAETKQDLISCNLDWFHIDKRCWKRRSIWPIPFGVKVKLTIQGNCDRRWIKNYEAANSVVAVCTNVINLNLSMLAMMTNEFRCRNWEIMFYQFHRSRHSSRVTQGALSATSIPIAANELTSIVQGTDWKQAWNHFRLYICNELSHCTENHPSRWILDVKLENKIAQKKSNRLQTHFQFILLFPFSSAILDCFFLSVLHNRKLFSLIKAPNESDWIRFCKRLKKGSKASRTYVQQHTKPFMFFLGFTLKPRLRVMDELKNWRK